MTKEEIEQVIKIRFKQLGNSEAIDWVKVVSDDLIKLGLADQQTKEQRKEIEELRKERDRLKKRNIVLSNDCCNANEAYTRKGIEITQLKAQLKEKSEAIISYIENDAEIAIPVSELFKEKDGLKSHLTKKEYGLVLLKHLVKELREKFQLLNNQ